MTAVHKEDATWLRRYHPGGRGGPLLICLAHAGGSATTYQELAKRLSDAVDTVAVQLPGRQDRRREPPVDDLPTLADRVAAVLDHQVDRERGRGLALFGHSMGATLAYEVALRLEDGGSAVTHVFASGRRAPSRYRPEQVHQRDDLGVLAEIAELEGTDTGLLADPDIIDMIMPALRSDYRAIETYQHSPGQLLRCPITALVGRHDPRTSLDEASAWAKHTSGPFELRSFAGGHFFLNGHTTAIAELISAALVTTSAQENGVGP